MGNLRIFNSNLFINENELHFSFIRAPGPGGQNVNKVATAVLLRFNVTRSPALTEEIRKRLLLLAGKKITLQGDLIIKATRYRTQESNKQDALNRLKGMLQRAAMIPKKRKKTKPSPAAHRERLAQKKSHAKIKTLRARLK